MPSKPRYLRILFAGLAITLPGLWTGDFHFAMTAVLVAFVLALRYRCYLLENWGDGLRQMRDQDAREIDRQDTEIIRQIDTIRELKNQIADSELARVDLSRRLGLSQTNVTSLREMLDKREQLLADIHSKAGAV